MANQKQTRKGEMMGKARVSIETITAEIRAKYDPMIERVRLTGDVELAECLLEERDERILDCEVEAGEAETDRMGTLESMSSETLKAIAHNLRRLRTKAGLSQASLAEAAGLAQPRISEIERMVVDNPELKTLEAIAGALGATVSQLTKQPKPEVR